MNPFSRQRTLILLAFLSCLFTSAASAQFKGDLFFDPPTLLVEEGSSADIEIKFFSGTDTVGSLLFDLRFEASEVSLDDPTLVDPSGVGFDHLIAAPLGQGLGFCAYNDDSFEEPFGTSTVFSTRITPLLSAGETTVLTLAPREGLKADGTPYASLGGLALAVTVVPSSSLPESDPGDLVYLRGPYRVPDPFSGLLIPVRRAGALLDSWEPGSFSGISPTLRLRQIQTLSGAPGQDTPSAFSPSFLRSAFAPR